MEREPHNRDDVTGGRGSVVRWQARLVLLEVGRAEALPPTTPWKSITATTSTSRRTDLARASRSLHWALFTGLSSLESS